MTFQTLTEARKQLSNKGLRDVHLRAVAKVRELKGREFELIELLQEVDDKKVYRFAGFNSLFNYCVQALELSENQACEYIAVARKAKEFPKLKAALKDQEISVTKARRLTAVITSENQDQWLKIAKNSSKRQLEKAIAGVSPRAVHIESSQYISADLLKLQVIIDEETLELIKRAQDLISQRERGPVSMGQAAKKAFGEFVEKHCPVKRAERAQLKLKKAGKKSPSSKTVSGPGQVNRENKTIAIKQPRLTIAKKSNTSAGTRVYPKLLVHQVMLRDRAQCTHRDHQGRRCPERRWLEIHHRHPLAQGGESTLENLTLLCKGHHQAIHSREMGYLKEH